MEPKYLPIFERINTPGTIFSPQSLHTALKHIGKAMDKWWQDPATQQPIGRNFGELMALVHTEIKEFGDALLADAFDDHLDHLMGYNVEAGDIIIRIFDAVYHLSSRNQWSLFCHAIEIHPPQTIDPAPEDAFVIAFKVASKVSEAVEHHRKGNDDWVRDLAGAVSVLINETVHQRLAQAIQEKMDFNAKRADHKHENRVKPGGKAY